MKRQQWLLFKVFSKTLTPQLNSYKNVRRLFCSAATTNMSFARLLEKKLPLLIVPYNHQGEGGDAVSKKETRLCGSVCDDTLGFISPFHAAADDDDQLQLVKKEKKKQEVYKVYLPEIADRRICGSSEGWLVTVHENSEVQLLNPISRVVVNLPPLITRFPEIVGKLDLKDNRGLCYLYLEQEQEDGCERSFRGYDSHYFRETFLEKVVTNTNTNTPPTDANSTLPIVVMAIYEDGNLAFCKPSAYGNGVDGDDQNKWVCFPEGDRCYCYNDITFYKGNFYAVGSFGCVDVVKGLDGPSPIVETVIGEPKFKNYSYTNYLVESSSSSSSSCLSGGDLLMVMRHVADKYEKERPYRTIGFKVLKLDFNGPSWVEVTNLGEDCALFIGYNHSFSFSVSKFPGSTTGCRGNCIYFTDNFFKPYNEFGGHDMGVYNIEDGSIEKLNYENSSQLIMPPPIWYVPN